MGDILKFIAIAVLTLLILAFALPILWLVIKEIGFFFGDLFCGISGSGLLWIGITIISIIAIIVMASN